VGIRCHAPLLGEHTEEVLTKILGYDKGRISSLYKSEVLYHEPAVDKLNGK
jgi:crotonobetainyl-CoA:carnitine CoA-transferase CaiB-like acyl-CoA transferase